MKNGLLILTIASLTVLSAQTAEMPRQQPQAWAEKLFGPPANLVHDFGMVPHGARLHHAFVVTNVYAVPIEITDVRVSMAPLTASASKQTLQPAESATISVEMDARRFTGPKTVSIYVSVGPTYVSTAVLNVKADSRADVIFAGSDGFVCGPGEVAFGSVAPGQTPSASVDLEYSGQRDWQVTDVVVPGDAPFDATVKELYRRPGQVGYRVETSLRKDAAPGSFHESILLKINDPKAGLLRIPVTGTVQSPFEAVPAVLDLKEVNRGETLTRRVFVRSPRPFKVVGIDGAEAVTLGEPPLPNGLQVVTLEIVAPPREGPFHFEVKIKTDLQDEPVVVGIDGVVSGK